MHAHRLHAHRMMILSARLAILLAPSLATAMVGNDAAPFNSLLGGTPEPTAPETLGSFTFGIEPLTGFELLGQRPLSLLDQASPPGDATDRKSNLAADDTSAQADDKAARRPASPDWPGIGRDTALFVAAQTVSVAVLYALQGDINRWSNKDVSLENWWDNVRNPEWDNDPWGTNYITHPYWGATYYIRARERGFSKLASFGYSAFLSTLYEYAPRPSSSRLRARTCW